MGKPTIEGTVSRRVELYCGEGNSNKDYIIIMTGVQGGYKVYSVHGPHGRANNGKVQTPSPVSLLSASTLVDDLVREKTQVKNYRLISDERPNSKANAAANALPSKSPASARKKMARASVAANSLSEANRGLLRLIF